jgi:hypothetical protein
LDEFFFLAQTGIHRMMKKKRKIILFLKEAFLVVVVVVVVWPLFLRFKVFALEKLNYKPF